LRGNIKYTDMKWCAGTPDVKSSLLFLIDIPDKCVGKSYLELMQTMVGEHKALVLGIKRGVNDEVRHDLCTI
jgi:hypothetical protein